MKWGVRRSVKKYQKKTDLQIQRNSENLKSIRRQLKSGIDDTTDGKLDADTKRAYNYEANKASKAVDAWIKAKKDFMNMNVNELTKDDVKKRFEKAQREAGVYYPF